MKKGILFIGMLLLLTAYSTLFADWQIKSSNFSYVSDVHFINETTGWVVTGLGGIGNTTSSFIIKTTDSGKTWFSQNTGTRLNLFSIHFIDENYGWAGGYRGILVRTTNGGETWESTKTSLSGNIRDIYFIDKNTGWAIGSYVYFTQDGGVTWKSQSVPLQTPTFNSIYFLSENEGWIAGAGFIIHTADGGANWTVQISNQKHTLSKIQFLNPNEGFASGDYGGFYKTVDGGANWTITELPQLYLRDLHFFDSNNGIMVDHNTLVLTTSDGGANWDVKTVNFTDVNGNPVLSAFAGLFFINSTGWIYSGTGPLITSNDAGKNWNIISYGQNVTMNKAVHCIDSQIAVVAGYNGIFKTYDGGDSWVTKVSRGQIYNSFESISFAGDRGWAVGPPNKIFTTTDKGDTWTYDSTDQANGFYGIKAIGNTAFAVSPYGDIQKTTGTGQWIKLNVGIQGSYYAVDFVNEQTGWVAGGNSTVIKTVDGGNSWTKLELGPDVPTQFVLKGVDFINENEGWVVGLPYFQLLHTTDGGQTWSIQSTGGLYGNNYLDDVQFLNNKEGYASGSGEMWKTTDGGESWERQILAFYDDVTDFSMADINTGWLVTSNRIHKTTDGGKSMDIGSAQVGLENNFDSGDLKKDFWETKITNAGATWQAGNFENKNFSVINNQNVYSAIIEPSSTAQDEWIISPKFDVEQGEAVIEFYVGYDAAKVKDANLSFQVYQNSFWGELWKNKDDSQGWKWRRVQISLAESAAKNSVRLAWVYKGVNGGQVAIDGIKIYSAHNIVTDMDENQPTQLPGDYKLYQNYPNPFNPVSNIKYEIANMEQVNLCVYDILGREVQILVDEVKAPGTYEVQFNGANLASGIYFYRLQTGRFTQVSKMILLK